MFQTTNQKVFNIFYSLLNPCCHGEISPILALNFPLRVRQLFGFLLVASIPIFDSSRPRLLMLKPAFLDA